jgi:hypothetical protein
MKKLITIAALLSALTSCEKNCYEFKCSQNIITYDKFGSESSSYAGSVDIYKCDLTNKDAKNYIKSMNGKVTSGSGNNKSTISTSCKIVTQ